MRREILNIAFAGLVAVGCTRTERPRSQNITPPSSVTGAPRYIPADQLPVSQERSGFIRYRGLPTAEHLQYIQKICGEMQISQQAPDVLIGTSAPDCATRLRSQKPS